MHELTLRAPEALVEPVSDALMDELGALSVSVEGADANTEAERALFGEPGMPAPRGGCTDSVRTRLGLASSSASVASSRWSPLVSQPSMADMARSLSAEP